MRRQSRNISKHVGTDALAIALQSGKVDPRRIVNAFLKYLEHERHNVTRTQFEENLALKMVDPAFLADISPLLSAGYEWDPEAEAPLVASQLIELLPGEPWKGEGVSAGTPQYTLDKSTVLTARKSLPFDGRASGRNESAKLSTSCPLCDRRSSLSRTMPNSRISTAPLSHCAESVARGLGTASLRCDQSKRGAPL